MDVCFLRVAGVLVRRGSVDVCIRVPKKNGRRRREVTQVFDVTFDGLRLLRDWLIAGGVTHVAVEARSPWWKPVWFALEDSDADLWLVDTRSLRKVPGRSPDVNDAAWIAQLLEAGLVRRRPVPSRPEREIQQLKAYRKQLHRARAREATSIAKLFEWAGLRFPIGATADRRRSGLALIDAFVAGERNDVKLAALTTKRLRALVPELQHLGESDAGEFVLRLASLHLRHVDRLDVLLAEVDRELGSR